VVIKAIIFDCFGVLVEDSLQTFYKTYLPDKSETVQQIQALDHQSTEGKITYDELLDHIAKLTGVERAEAKHFLEQNPPNLPLFDYIASELKPQYKLGFLSNAADDWLGELFTLEQLALFDDFVLSYQHNMRKPDVAIFELAANRLGVSPNECVLVDDIEAYCQGAREVGMQTVQYASLNQAKSDLEAIIK
jgi:epoxide hydrolase-like predicted phosphatase